MSGSKVVKTAAEWKAILDPAQFAVLRNKATEKPNTGKYNHFSKPGVYECVGCGNPLYTSSSKFDSGCGWPAFYQAIPGAINLHKDSTLGMERTEMTCAKCDGHLGHVFYNEGFKNPTNERHCVNSISLKFNSE
ncbi:peptide-methionine (R)-S-oxide reductase [Starmerella bacillaris]|uniref:Peptide-methionine (R)-S-oxide reductase n=1 Tax=Starmerella bacillaris TaxID=1247836 RepID=A0AAV5REF5_STABA|nr:peptide-methionine (R)-S-oxide reductase [Starmerella bacillaris]